MSTGGGIVAALSAPFLLDVGFLIWDKHWKGSSFALNLYKCTLASIGFLILSFATRPPGAAAPADDDDAAEHSGRGPAFPPELFTVQSVGFLMLSSTIGILIGDWTWLEALELIGARPVVLMDSIKPFLAALLGWAILGESLQWPAFVGMALTVGGVVWVSLEREGGDGSDDDDGDDKGDCKDDDKSDRFEDDHDAEDGQQNDGETKVAETATKKRKPAVTAKTRRKGYALSVANVVLDTYGSLLTKQYGKGMSTWNISLIRFGFASAFCIALSSILNLRDALKRIGSRETKSDTSIPTSQATNYNRSSLRGSIIELFNYRLGKDMAAHIADIEEPNQNKSIDKEQEDNDEVKPRPTDNSRPWYSLPNMTREKYAIISLGVAFTTFATPALSNYALFQIALALALTLGSMGPVYMLPLSWLIQGDRPTFRACLGAVLAVAGVAILSFFG